MVVTVSHAGYVKRNTVTAYRAQKRGGRGVTGASTKDEDFVAQLFVASTHDHILMFTSMGRVYAKRVYELPEGSRASRGKALVNFLELKENEKRRRDAAAQAVRGRASSSSWRRRTAWSRRPRSTLFSNIRSLGHHRAHHRRGRRAGRGPPHRRAARHPPRHARRARHPLPRGEGARHGPHRARRQGHQPARQGRGGRAARPSRATRRPRCITVCEHGYGKRTAGRRVPGQGPRRHRRHHHQDHRAQRQGRRLPPRHRRRGPHAHHRRGQGHPHPGQGHPDARPQHAGRAPGARRRRRERGRRRVASPSARTRRARCRRRRSRSSKAKRICRATTTTTPSQVKTHGDDDDGETATTATAARRRMTASRRGRSHELFERGKERHPRRRQLAGARLPRRRRRAGLLRARQGRLPLRRRRQRVRRLRRLVGAAHRSATRTEEILDGDRARRRRRHQLRRADRARGASSPRSCAAAVPSMEMVRLVSSGTEATMAALRVARGFTGRDKIVKIDGGYHGARRLRCSSPPARASPRSASPARPASPPAPPPTRSRCRGTTKRPCAPSSTPTRGQIAAVIVEPVCGNMGCVPPRAGYLAGAARAHPRRTARSSSSTRS